MDKLEAWKLRLLRRWIRRYFVTDSLHKLFDEIETARAEVFYEDNHYDALAYYRDHYTRAATSLSIDLNCLAATPANGEQVERADREVVSWIAAHLRAGNTEAAFRAAAKHRAATPTEDARERVKVLEEALEAAAYALEVVIMQQFRGRTFPAAQGEYDKAMAPVYAAHTALGNKETDRHG